jgi:hypothetical protein
MADMQQGDAQTQDQQGAESAQTQGSQHPEGTGQTIDTGKTFEAPPPETVSTDRYGDWRDQIHSDIRGNEKFAEIKGIDGLAREYLAELARQEDRIGLPGENATDEEITEFFRNIGIPEDMAEYEAELKDYQPPEGIEVDQDFLKEAMEQAYELHMYPHQFKEIVNWYYNRLSNQVQEIKTQQLRAAENAREQLQKEWGKDYRRNSSIVSKALEALGGDELLDWAEEAGVANDTVFIKMIYTIGKNLSEDMVLQGVPARGREPVTPGYLSYDSTPEHGGV